MSGQNSPDLVTRFNDASSTTVALSTLGVVAATYTLVKAFQNRKQLLGGVIKQVRALPIAKGLIDDQLSKSLDDIDKTLRIPDDKNVIKTIPENGWSHEDILNAMESYREQEISWQDGKLSGIIYHGGKEHTEMMNKAYSLFSLSNPLHPEVFRSVRKFEAEIISMAVDMLAPGVPGVCGALTSGGTESILMAVKAHRDYFNVPNPEMIIPLSAHAAFNKAASYFGIKLVIIPVDEKTQQVKLNEMRAAINKNTILLVGSAPSYAHGVIDQISEIGAMAKEFNIGCHVDCCLGGFVLPWIQDGSIPPFDFRVDGVTSISADTHKYGYSVKGTSVVLFRNEAIRKAMYFITTEWPGGIYASPTIAGSRPGGLIAATWASLISIGKNGYLKNVAAIMETARTIKKGISEIPELALVGDSKTMVISFTSKVINPFSVSHEMHHRGWVLNALQKPDSVHICVTFAHAGKGEQFVSDLKESVEAVKKVSNEKPKEGSAAHLYGLAYGFPDRSLIKDMISGYLDTCLKV